ncbi:formimidoylglutamate deiminase [Massilia sp. 9096]|uniref:formimidoylglutamate deiminase n=1 Tax=Massilia sp. 9096 TaxID=1500894 RepID=UPI0005629E69|nr:formimidoylglutamate deiminase [Massilia sp. 9096]
MSAAADARAGALFAHHALLPQGWRRDVLLEWNVHGDLTSVAPDTARTAQTAQAAQAEYVLPGMVNLHSHAFQRALAGLTERAGSASGKAAGKSADSFWTWRELMYRFAGRITPAQIEAIAAQLYAECLRHGYTAMCEFHYIQRDVDGAPYARPAHTAERIAAAARQTGIGLTLLPVLYAHSGFNEQPLIEAQRRFRSDPEFVLRVVEALEGLRGPQLEVGAAPHSLRAASMAQVRELAQALPAGRPLHIHIAEQQLEVDQCLQATGRRPVDYLFDEMPVDARWCLVHATHLSASEVARIAASGAVAGLCPTTEANLGDGLFPLEAFLQAGGRFGIGSDSHVSHSPVEELRWLEYGQRLLHRRRNIAVTDRQRDVATLLWQRALQGGAQASGRRLGALQPGSRADLLVLDAGHPNLDGAAPGEVPGRLLFCGNDNLVRDVLAGGAWVVRDGRHVAQEEIARDYKMALRALRAA